MPLKLCAIIKVRHRLTFQWSKGQVWLGGFEYLAVSSPELHPPLEWVPGSHSPGAGTSAVVSLSLHNPLRADHRSTSREMVWILHRSRVSSRKRTGQKWSIAHHLTTASEKACSEWNKSHNGIKCPHNRKTMSNKTKEFLLNRVYSQFHILQTHSQLFCFYWFCLRSLWRGEMHCKRQ